ncbi:MAG: glycerate kinase [Alphaproteobacteria bacterium]
MTLDHAQLLRRLFDAAIQAARPAHCLPPWLPPPPLGRTLVLGAGKASAAMAQALEQRWQGALNGLVVTQYGHSVSCERIAIVEAAHPVPDEAGLAAARHMLELTNGLTADDLVICLFSGGGSALLPLPLDGLTLQDKQDATSALLKSGATIREINCVRRHLSAIKGGRLAAACHPAQVLTLLISDVPGDDPVDIASGPTVGDPTTCEEALEILRRYRADVTDRIQEILQSGRGETLKPDDPLLARSTVKIVATPHMALQAAADTARQAGVMPLILGDAIEGEAREVGAEMAGRALHVARANQLPCVLLSGGETTVLVTGRGRGGRNVEFLLALGLALDGHPGIYALAGDTDGMDGTEPIAGALLCPDSLARAKELGLQARVSLHDNDAHGFFSALGDSVVTGPTLTNVNDFRAILVTPEAAG